MTAMRHVGRSFAPVIKPQTAGGRAPCSFPPSFSRRSREEKRGGNRRKHGCTADSGLLLMEGVKLLGLFRETRNAVFCRMSAVRSRLFHLDILLVVFNKYLA